MALRVSLFTVFSVEMFLVAAAFAALIAMMSERQRLSFREDLHERLRVQQLAVMEAVALPITARVRLFLSAAYPLYVGEIGAAAGSQTAQGQTDLTLPTTNNSLGDLPSLYRALYGIPVIDTRTLEVSVMTLTTVPLLNASSSSSSSTSGGMFWNALVIDKEGAVLKQLGTSTVCDGAIPVNLTACVPTLRPSRSNATIEPSLHALLVRNTTTNTTTNNSSSIGDDAVLATREGITFDAAHIEVDDSNGQRLRLLPVFVPLRWAAGSSVSAGADAVIRFSISLTFVAAALRSVVTDRATVAAVGAFVPQRFIAGPGTIGSEDCRLVASVGVLPVIDDTGSGSGVPRLWPCVETPDNTLNLLWVIAAREPCSVIVSGDTATQCDAPVVFEQKIDGVAVVAAAQRLRTLQRLDLMLVQYTPHDHLYAASEAARRDGIIVGAAAAVVAVGLCATVMAAIRHPLRLLGSNMQLAALLKNDEVTAAAPWRVQLREIAELVSAFDTMNTKLLLARPFMPQSLLMAESEDSNEDDRQEEGPFGKGTHTADNTEADLDLEGSGVGSANDADVASNSGSHPRARSGRRRSKAASCNAPNSSGIVVGGTSVVSEGPSGGSSGGTSASSRDLALRGASLHHRRICVLVCNVRGFHAAQRANVPDMLARLHKRLAEAVERATTEHRGLVDAFHGDRFVCTFNAVRPCALSAVGAVRTAGHIEHALDADVALRVAFPDGLAMGACGGRVLVGNLGTATMQRLSIVGEAFTEATGLEGVMTRTVQARIPVEALIGRCLVTGRTAAEVDHCCTLQVIGACDAARIFSGVEVRRALRDGSDDPTQASPASTANHSQQKTCASAPRHADRAQGVNDALLFDVLGIDKTCNNNNNSSATVLLVSVMPRAERTSMMGGDEWLYELQTTSQESSLVLSTAESTPVRGFDSAASCLAALNRAIAATSMGWPPAPAPPALETSINAGSSTDHVSACQRGSTVSVARGSMSMGGWVTNLPPMLMTAENRAHDQQPTGSSSSSLATVAGRAAAWLLRTPAASSSTQQGPIIAPLRHWVQHIAQTTECAALGASTSISGTHGISISELGTLQPGCF